MSERSSHGSSATEPTIIRCSSLSGWPDCPRRGAARLFRREIEAAGFRLRHTLRGIGAAIGTAVHRSAEIVLREKAHSGSLPPLSVATDCAVDTLGEEIGRGEIGWDGSRGATHNVRDAERQVVSMSSAYHRVVAPAVHPIMAEERLEAEVEPGLVLSGQPDLVAREPHAVRDLKTGVRAPASFAPQLGGYSLLARSHKLDIDTANIDFIARASANKPQPDPVTKEVMVAQAETAAVNILRHIAGDIATFRHGDTARRIRPGDPWAFQANPASVLCSPKWCPAFGTDFCREGDPAKERE
jgi:PD-(D/E)XK nuclease superfamily